MEGHGSCRLHKCSGCCGEIGGPGTCSVPLGVAQRHVIRLALGSPSVRNGIEGPPCSFSSSCGVPAGNSSEAPLVLDGVCGVGVNCPVLGEEMGQVLIEWYTQSKDHFVTSST